MSSSSNEHTMSYREKLAWICLVTTLGVYVPYAYHVFRLYYDGGFTTSGVYAAMLITIFFQIALTCGATLLFAIRQRQEPRDERDQAIEARAYRNAYWLLGCSAYSVAMMIPVATMTTIMDQTNGRPITLVAGQALLLCFVAAEIVRYLTVVIGYRRLL